MGYRYGQLSGRELARDAWSISKDSYGRYRRVLQSQDVGDRPWEPVPCVQGASMALAITACVLCTGTVAG